MTPDELTDLREYLRLCDSLDWWLSEAEDQDITLSELFRQQDKPS